MPLADNINAMSAFSIGSAASAWKVFTLFLIPVGGGIPAGALLAQSRGVGWVTMALLYFVSDIVLALLFEPFMMLFLSLSKRIEFLAKLREAFQKSTAMTVARFGTSPGPFLLITIAFGVDPMTGRAAAHAAGHGFIAGWAIAIIGDMFFFAVVAISTICLNDILGDGTWAALIIMFLMVVIPAIFRRFRTGKRDFRENGAGTDREIF